MDTEKVCLILDELSGIYHGGAYPGRSSEGLNPEWPCDPFHVLIATILSQRTKDDNTRNASDALFNRFGTLDAIADADESEVAGLIRPAGFPTRRPRPSSGAAG